MTPPGTPPGNAATTGVVLTVKNAGEATVQGLEAELRLHLGDHLELGTALGWIDAEYDEFFVDLVGTGVPTDNRHLDLKHTPEYNYNLSLRYAQPLDEGSLLTFFASLSGQAESWASTANVPGSLLDEHHLTDLRISYDFGKGRYEVAAWGKNLSGEEYKTGVLQLVGSLGYVNQYYGPPESYGLGFQVRF